MEQWRRWKGVVSLTNAVKYRPGGSVRLACDRVAGERLRIAVVDTGPGIPPEALRRLFVPFERLSSEQHGVEGTGLGLRLSKGLAEAMGGTLGLTTAVDQGSAFWVELPLTDNPVARADRQQGEPTLAEAAADPARPALSVLYIEDNVYNLQLVEQVLKSFASSSDVITAHHRPRPQ